MTLKLGQRKVDVGPPNALDQDLKYNRNGHPVVSLLRGPSDRTETRDRTTTLEDVYDVECNWSEPENAYYTVVKKGVRRRVKGLTTAAVEAHTEQVKPREATSEDGRFERGTTAEDLGILYLDHGRRHDGF